jgi:thioredoxin 1
MGPVLEEIEESVKDKTDIIKVNIDNFNELADQYKVMSIPTLLFIKDGEVIKEEVGYRDNDTLVGIINDTFK